MTRQPETRQPTWTPWRWAVVGFVVGLVIPLPATFFALISRPGEVLLPYLVPSAELLSPLADAMASWPGLLNMSIVSVLNGVTYGVVAGALGGAVAVIRHRQHNPV